eukprot:5328075-Amphidinium_carterae.1
MQHQPQGLALHLPLSVSSASSNIGHLRARVAGLLGLAVCLYHGQSADRVKRHSACQGARSLLCSKTSMKVLVHSSDTTLSRTSQPHWIVCEAVLKLLPGQHCLLSFRFSMVHECPLDPGRQSWHGRRIAGGARKISGARQMSGVAVAAELRCQHKVPLLHAVLNS